MNKVARAVCLQISVAAWALAGVTTSAQGQWVVVSEGAVAGATRSGAYASDGVTHGGWAEYAGEWNAVLWTGTPGPLVNLQPAGATNSWVNGVHGSRQAGYVFMGGTGHASLWSGSAASWIDLTPAGATDSIASAISGDVQVGNASFAGGLPRASLWRGSAATWIDLSPPGSYSSSALGVRGDTQVGTAGFQNEGEVAGLWRGSGASWVRLGPPRVMASSSAATCVYGNQQGGTVFSAEMTPQASVWSGSAESWVNLSPGWSSFVYGIGRGTQVGIRYQGVSRAAKWTSSEASYEDLHQYLPADYAAGASVASAIAFFPDSTYIVGSAQYRGSSRYDTVVWIGPATPCFLVSDPNGAIHCPRDAGSSHLQVSATGYLGVLRYQWLRDGVAIDVSQNPSAATADLVVTGGGAAGEYRCVLTDDCGSVTSGPATVSVCFAEFNCDGFLDFFDYDDFVAAFESGDPAADVNGDAFLDFFDYTDFVSAFETGC